MRMRTVGRVGAMCRFSPCSQRSPVTEDLSPKQPIDLDMSEETILVTGYGGWANHDTNPSALLAETVTGLSVASGRYKIVTDVLPVDWVEGPAKLVGLIEQHQPKAIVCLGLAGGCAGMRVERVAVNLSNGADNAELKREDGPLEDAGPDALLATLPTRKMLKGMADAGVPAALSMSAGTYLCNAAMYTAIRHSGGAPAGFIHVRHPYHPSARDCCGH